MQGENCRQWGQQGQSPGDGNVLGRGGEWPGGLCDQNRGQVGEVEVEKGG